MKQIEERPIAAQPVVLPGGTFEDLYVAEYHPMVRRAYVLVGGDGPAEEVAQDGFARVSMCRLRDEWLAADGATGGAEPVRRLGDLCGHAAETGLDQNSDIVVFLDRLLAAMAAGDAEEVRSIPEGGACG